MKFVRGELIEYESIKNKFSLSFSSEPLAFAEYACRLSNTPSTSVIQFDTCQDYYYHQEILETGWTS